MKKNIWLIFLFVLTILATYLSAYGQKPKPRSIKPTVVVNQPKKTSPSPKSETQNVNEKQETQDGQKPLTNADIVQMVKASFGESIVLNAIQTNETQFDVSMKALFELKDAGVSQKIIEAIQSTRVSKQQDQPPSIKSPLPQPEPQPTPSNITNSSLISATQDMPVYGTIKDIKEFKRIYINVENEQSRERIIKTLNKSPEYQIVNDPQEAQMFLEYRVLSRDERSDTSDTDLRIKSQLNAVYIKNNKRIISWSDSVDHVRKTLGGIGFRSTHNEIKLTERFLKALKD